MFLMLRPAADPVDQAALEAACQGPPLRSAQARNDAAEAGYDLHPAFRCVTKVSFQAVEKARLAAAAYNAPEARARREAAFAAREAERLAEAAREAEARKERAAREAAAEQAIRIDEVRPVEANTASETQLAAVLGIGPRAAEAIVKARAERRFADWGDLVARVVPLSAAEPAVRASVTGLTVNGRSLDGAPANAQMATLLARRLARNARPTP